MDLLARKIMKPVYLRIKEIYIYECELNSEK
jgi:hypothetical protein